MLPASGVPYKSRNSRCISYLCAEWGGLFDQLVDVPWRNVFKIGASAYASELCEWIQFGIDG